MRSQGAAPSRPRSSTISPLTGRTGGRAGSGSHSVAPGPGAAGEDDGRRAQLLAGGGPHPDQALALEEAGDDLGAGRHLRPGSRRAPPAAPRSAPAGRPPPRRERGRRR